MRHETKCGKATGVQRQKFRSYRSSGVAETRDWQNSQPSARRNPRNILYLLQLRNSCNFFFSRSCTDVFSGIGIKLGDRSLFGCLLNVINVIPNDLLRLRVVDHH